jgi:hypothetical protein
MLRRTCGDCRLRFLLQAGHGCGLHPAFPAPSEFQEDATRRITRAFLPRECEVVPSPLFDTLKPMDGGARLDARAQRRSPRLAADGRDWHAGAGLSGQ